MSVCRSALLLLLVGCGQEAQARPAPAELPASPAPPPAAPAPEATGPGDAPVVVPVLDEINLMLGLEKQVHLEAVIGDRGWEMDIPTGVLSFGDDLRFRAEVLGSFSAGTETWLWAWANTASGLPPAAVQQSLAVKAVGEASGEEVITSPKLPVDEFMAFSIALAVAGRMDDIRAVYRGPHDGGAVFLVITDDAFPALPAPTTARFLRIITQAMDSGLLQDSKRAILGWLELRGFSLDDQGATVVATAPGVRIELAIEDGEVTGLTGGNTAE